MELTVTQRFFQVQIFIIINALGKKVNIILESYRIYSKLNRFKYFMPGTRSTPNPVEWWKPSIINGQSMKFDVSLITQKRFWSVRVILGSLWSLCRNNSTILGQRISPSTLSGLIKDGISLIVWFGILQIMLSIRNAYTTQKNIFRLSFISLGN